MYKLKFRGNNDVDMVSKLCCRILRKPKDFYEVLDVMENAELPEILQAYGEGKH